jgi:multicomponent Na+:H+ antiporter subunit E
MFDMPERALPAAARSSGDGRQPAPRGPSAARAARLRSAILAGTALGGLWLVLTDLEPASLVFGMPAILAGAALAALFPPAPPWRIAPLAALGFAGFFASQSVRGALDVARRALDPRLPLRPGFRTVILTLGPGPGRVLLANTVSLLPGTLSAEIEGRRLIVHTLDLESDLAADVAALEARIRAAFGRLP